MSKAPSAPIRLLQLVWNNCNDATPHSYERLNHAMQDALRLAIGYGFRFDVDDFRVISKKFRFGYWSGETSGEQFYSLAVTTNNISACRAFETWSSRKPIIADGVGYGNYVHSGYLHCAGQRARGRLCVGARFSWKGEFVEVTSMHDKGYAIACSYKKGELDEPYSNRKILHRYKITPKMIIKDRAERKGNQEK